MPILTAWLISLSLGAASSAHPGSSGSTGSPAIFSAPSDLSLAHTIQCWVAAHPTPAEGTGTVQGSSKAGLGAEISDMSHTASANPSSAKTPRQSAAGSSNPPSTAAGKGTAPSYGQGAGAPSTSTSDAAARHEMLTLLNQARTEAGLAPLALNSQLASLAQSRAQAMITDGYFSEDSPVYGWPIQMEQAAGIQAQSLGAENIAEAPSIPMASALLMASPPHRANILTPYFSQVGIGAAYSPGTGWIVSELFAGPSQ
jgi:uncharacterized protein YkwD